MSDRSILLLGVPRVERDKSAVQIERRKALGLLAYLTVTGQTHSRETLAALFWADYDHTRAHAYLRNNLWTLNKALGDDWAFIDNETVKFNETAINVDVNHFHALLQTTPTTGENHQAAVQRLTQAIALYRGDFLTGLSLRDCSEFEVWQTLQTETLRREFAGALERLIDHLITLDDFENAKTQSRRWLSLDSLHEPAHRQLMRLYAWTGQHTAALRQYKDLENLLERELGVSPDGMPLAIELAATWIQILSCEEIAQEIQKGLDILTTEIRNIPERHRSLRAVFEQTWERLNLEEQNCLARLSTLRGGFHLEAAQAVAGASLPLLLSLTSKSLLRRNENQRYEIHELLRQYAEQ